MRSFIALLVAIAVLAVPMQAAIAIEPEVTVELRSDFDPLAIDYEHTDPDTGVTVVLQGVLLSESSYRDLLFIQKELKLDLDLASSQAESWRLRWEVDMQVKNAHIGVLEVQLSKTNTWFARNKGGIGFSLGVFVTVLSSIGLAYAFAGAGNVAGGN